MPFLASFKHGIEKGREAQAPFDVMGWQIQPLICYEIAFPGLAHRQSTQQAKSVDALVTLSNDGWFGLSHGPSQHFQMAQFRAKELGRPVIRATNTGITGIIGADGEVLSIAPRQELTALGHKIERVQGRTPYSIMGPNSILMIISLAFVIRMLWSRRYTNP